MSEGTHPIDMRVVCTLYELLLLVEVGQMAGKTKAGFIEINVDEVPISAKSDICRVSTYRKYGEFVVDKETGKKLAPIYQNVILNMPKEDTRVLWPKDGQKGVPSEKVASESVLYIIANQDSIEATIKEANEIAEKYPEKVFVAGKPEPKPEPEQDEV